MVHELGEIFAVGVVYSFAAVAVEADSEEGELVAGLGGGLAREEAAPWQAKFGGVAGVAISGFVEGGVGTQAGGALNGVLAIVGQEPISMKLDVGVAGLRDWRRCDGSPKRSAGCPR